jgi:CheY-like chemotaxis protein
VVIKVVATDFRSAEVYMKKRILLVEDNPPTVDIVKLELELLGYEVMVAPDGLEAVKMATSESPDLIVMDIQLPKLNGLQAVSQIRANMMTRTVPILAATAKALANDRATCLEAGCDEYIAKPFTHTELGSAIQRLLSKHS